MASTTSKIPMPDSFAKLLLSTHSHLGGTKSTSSMSKYVFGKRRDRIHVFDIDQTWEKMILAARAFVGIENSESMIAISGKTFGRKSVLKFAEKTFCMPRTGRLIPGSFTNMTLRGIRIVWLGEFSLYGRGLSKRKSSFNSILLKRDS